MFKKVLPLKIHHSSFFAIYAHAGYLVAIRHAGTVVPECFIYLLLQDAQLSQRDRAAGFVTVFAKSRRLELRDNIYGHYRSIVNHCDIIGLKICRIP